MRRTLTLMAISALLAVAGPGHALAQTKEQPPDGGSGGSIEPAPAWYVDISVVAILVDGAEVERVPVGRKAQLRLRATNTSDKAANDVTVALEAPANATLSDRSLSFGDLGAQKSADATTTIEITSEKDCQDFIGWVGTVRSSLGEQMTKFGVAVDCPGPRLAIEKWEFVGGDGDDIPEPGEKLLIFLTYRNDGRDPATNVRAALTTASTGVTVTDAQSAFGTIAPRSSQRATDPFAIEIASDAPLQNTGCESSPVQEGPPPTADDTDGSVSSDGTVSSDGSTSGGGFDGSTGSAGGSEPSNGGDEPREAPAPGEAPPDGQTTIEPDPGSGTVEPEPTVTDQPARDPNAQPVPEERRFEEQDPSVAIEGQLKVTSAEISFDDTFSNQMACMMLQRGAPGDDSVGAPEADGRQVEDLLATGARSSGTQRSGPIALAVVLLAAVGSQVGWRLMRARV